MNQSSFILNNIENFLNFELHPNTISKTLALKPASEWIEFCDKECQLGIIRLKGLRYQISAVDFNRYIQLTYADTSALIDCVRNYELSLPESDGIEELRQFYPDLIAALVPVMMYMERNIGQCYDPSQLLPQYELKQHLEHIRQQSLVLKAKFKSREVEPAFQKILNEWLEGILQWTCCSYQGLSYTNQLIAGLSEVLLRIGNADPDMALIRCLVNLNFNEPAFYEYVKQRLTALLDQEQQLERQCSALRFYIKEIKTLLPKPNMALNPQARDIKSSLLRFLQAELQFRELESASQASPSTSIQPLAPRTSKGSAGLTASAPSIGSASKLKLNTNMRQMAICINILIQLGVFVLEKSGIKGVLGFIVAHISTQGSENLSIDSLQKRISEKNTAAALGLQRILEEMLVILKRDYLN